MSWFKRKKSEPYVYTWESEPFVFQPGMIYVIEVNTAAGISLDEIAGLRQFFQDAGIIVKLVLVKGSMEREIRALNPITVKRKKEQV